MLNPKPTKGNIDWFTRDRFGMFIHWGLYAMPARHEWVKQREEMTDEQYEPFFAALTHVALTLSAGRI